MIKSDNNDLLIIYIYKISQRKNQLIIINIFILNNDINVLCILSHIQIKLTSKYRNQLNK